MKETYFIAQSGITQLKQAIHVLLASVGDSGLTNAEIGRTLGIYAGHAGHEGHISRTLLALMGVEAVVEQNPDTKRWKLCNHINGKEIK